VNPKSPHSPPREGFIRGARGWPRGGLTRTRGGLRRGGELRPPAPRAHCASAPPTWHIPINPCGLRNALVRAARPCSVGAARGARTRTHPLSPKFGELFRAEGYGRADAPRRAAPMLHRAPRLGGAFGSQPRLMGLCQGRAEAHFARRSWERNAAPVWRLVPRAAPTCRAAPRGQTRCVARKV
jgi:hypothetical protein